MTSSNGNIFRVTGTLWGEFTGHQWIPLTKASDMELWCFLWANSWASHRDAGDLRCHRAHYDVTVILGESLPRPSSHPQFRYYYDITRAIDALAACITRSSATMGLTVRWMKYYFPWGRISTTCTMCTSALAMELHPSCTYPSIQPSHSLPLVSSPCGLFGTKFSNFQFDPEWYFQRNFISKYTNFHWTKCIWKCYLQYDSHFVQASICWRLGFDDRNGCMCMLHMESSLIS